MSTKLPRLGKIRFFTTYKPDHENPKNMVGVDWVEYSALGQEERSSTTDRISRLSSFLDGDDRTNPSIGLAKLRWEIIGPAYDAWKKGNELPVNGTPLAAWNGLTPEQAELFKSKGIRTVEDIAEMPEVVRTRIPLPGLGDIMANAKRYVLSADSRIVAEQLRRNESDIDAAKAELADKDEQIRALMSKVDQLVDMVATGKAADEDGEETEGEAPVGERVKRKYTRRVAA